MRKLDIFLILNATDADNDKIIFDINPKKPFFIYSNELFSQILTKQDLGKQELTLTVSDLQFVDKKHISTEVFEINNPPKIKRTTVKTVSLNFDNSLKIKPLTADEETPQEELSFNINFLSGETIFDISPDGNIETILNEFQIGGYLVEICVRDKGISSKNSNKKICPEVEPKSSCSSFQLTVLQNNRPPTITVTNPKNFQLNASQTETTFSIASFDPDGSKPDIFWYVDGVLEKEVSGLDAVQSNLSMKFNCNSIRTHEVKVEITDGLLNDSVIWRVQSPKQCLTEKTSSDCSERLACSNWDICQDAPQSFEFNIISKNDYDIVSKDCSEKGFPENVCGFQIRNCVDANSCNSSEEKPISLRACHFTFNPSCSDNIQNCHGNSCEILVDCGSPCNAWSTCFDGILRNSTLGYGNSTLFTLNFTPNFTDETTCTGSVNLTLNVSNAKLSNSSSWSVNITHTNYPLIFSSDIPNQSGGSPRTVNLSNYFLDYDALDSCYNQSVDFTYTKTSGDAQTVSITNWAGTIEPVISFASTSSTTAEYIVKGFEDNQFVNSNTFEVEISVSQTIVTSSGGGGSSSSSTIKLKPVSLRIIVPGTICSQERQNNRSNLPKKHRNDRSWRDNSFFFCHKKRNSKK